MMGLDVWLVWRLNWLTVDSGRNGRKAMMLVLRFGASRTLAGIGFGGNCRCHSYDGIVAGIAPFYSSVFTSDTFTTTMERFSC